MTPISDFLNDKNTALLRLNKAFYIDFERVGPSIREGMPLIRDRLMVPIYICWLLRSVT